MNEEEIVNPHRGSLSLFAEKNDAPNLHHRNMPPERWGFIKESLEADG
jgi:hypothetical protein